MQKERELLFEALPVFGSRATELWESDVGRAMGGR